MPESRSIRDTIFALSSGFLPSGVAVIRITGEQSRDALIRLAGKIPEPRMATLLALKDGSGALIDNALCLFFPGPHSFTGEDCAEIQCHGGKAVVARMLQVLAEQPGLRSAEAGEFTKRAFLNGKIDLTRAEALSDLISAETEAQRRFAIQNGSDEHRRLYNTWRERLIHIRAFIEADLDFSDEGDVPESVAARIGEQIATLIGEIREHHASYHYAEILRDGLQVVLLGAPNAGKSSLLNILAKRDVAIVTDEAGTTRDVLDVELDLAGLKVRISDTAGIRTAEGKVEAIGIERSLARAAQADLILLVEDMANPVPIEPPADVETLVIGNKSDLKVNSDKIYDCLLSTHSMEGLDHLLELLKERAQRYTMHATEIIPFRARHMDLLAEAIGELELAQREHDLELTAERLRLASLSLERISGHIDVEDLLDTIFSSFCIGK